MAGAAAHWQLEFEKVEERCGYLLNSGQWSDCTFMVGSENQEVIQAHKLVLAIASPVFEAMFYGGLSEHKDTIVPIVPIPDVQPEVFRALLQYIYTGNIDICSFDMALDLWYGAKKYMLPHLEKQCTSYICSFVHPGNACQAYELARLFEEKLVMDKCIQIISTNTKEVLNDSSFVDVELKTLITVCSLDHLTVDSELDLFQAVARYAEAEQRRQISPAAEGHSTTFEEKVLFPSAASCSKTSPAVQLDSKPPTKVVTSEPTADKENLKEEEPSIRAALQKIRFLTLAGPQFAEGPARSALLTKEESLAVLMNIVSGDGLVPMPTGLSECRQPRSDSQKNDQCFKAGCLDHIINALKCGEPSQDSDSDQVKDAVQAAFDILCLGPPPRIQAALDKGILDALVPVLNKGSVKCKEQAAQAIYWLCVRASPAQLRVLAEGAALPPCCRLLAATRDGTCFWVLSGLTDLLKRVEQNTVPDLLQRLQALGVPQLLLPLQQHSDEEDRELANNLLRTYFSDH